MNHEKENVTRIIRNTPHYNNVLHNLHQRYTKSQISELSSLNWFKEFMHRKEKSSKNYSTSMKNQRKKAIKRI